jgi:hypothetical protein
VTQHGSFPGRPRGRRARRDNDVPDDVPEWAGYDAVPKDQQEFPDLSPIRGQSGQSGPGTGPLDRGTGPLGSGTGPLGSGTGPLGSGTGPLGSGTGPLGTGPAASGQRGQVPWDDQPWPTAPAPHETQQPSQPPLQPQAQRAPVQPRSERPDSDWAGPTNPDPMEAFSERWRRRGSESRGERRADRRKRRRLYVIAGSAAAVVIAVATYFIIGNGGGNPAGVGLNSLITSFLPGEIQQVPNACDAVPSASLAQYLPGKLVLAEPPLNSGLNTQCTWTLDKAPVYRVLEVNIQAYSPSGLASGDGSATFAAIDAYAEDEQVKQDPGPHSGQPKATVTDLSGMPGGNQTVAFQATQVFSVSGAITDVATVVVRYRNVIVTVVMNGLDQANKGSKYKYGPVSMSDLTAAAQAVAQEVTGKLVH